MYPIFFLLLFLLFVKLDAKESPSCQVGLHPMRITARHIESGGIGYNEGYTTLEGFFASDPSSSGQIGFVDVRGHVFDDGRLAANGGLGWRMSHHCRTYGVNAYYDYRKTKRKQYSQIGAGLETLGEVYDIRINGYFPIGSRVSHPYDPQFSAFQGNQILVSQKFEFSQYGVHPEVGFHCGSFSGFDLYAAVGPYYFGGKFGENTWGGQARVAARFKEYVFAEVTESYDSTFHNHVQGEIGFSLPLGPRVLSKKECCAKRNRSEMITNRLLQPVFRDEIIVVDHRKKKSVAINPATGLPFFVLFVDNTSHSNGTFESPFNTLADAETASNANDIIYVFPGDGSTTGMDAGITLKDNQQLLGSGFSHPLTTKQGAITLPALNGFSPAISNSAAVITAANHNVISGFNIQSSSSNGISASDVQGITITNNVIQGTSGTGIVFSDVSGTAQIENNSIVYSSTAVTLTNSEITNFKYIFSNNQIVALAQLNLTDCSKGTVRFNSNILTATSGMFPPPGNFIGTLTDVDSVNVSFSNNQFTAGDALISLTTTSGTTGAAIDIASNTGFSSGNNPFLLTLSGSVTASITGNDVSSSNTPVRVIAGADSVIALNVSGNKLQMGSTLFQINNNGGTVSGNVTNNAFYGRSDATIGFNFGATDGSDTTLNVSNNQFFGGSRGISAIGTANDDRSFTIQNNTFMGQTTGSTASGFTGENAGSGLYTYNFQNNRFSGEENGAVALTNSGTGTTCLRFVDQFSEPFTGAYTFTGSSGTFNVEPLVGNIGEVTQSGTTSVPAGTCN